MTPPVRHRSDPVTTFKVVPTEYAEYGTPAGLAARMLRLTTDELRELADGRIPSRQGPDGELRYEFADVYNLAATAGTGTSVFELGLRFLMRFAAEQPERWIEERAWRVSIVPPAGQPLSARALDTGSPQVLDASGHPQEQSAAGDDEYYDLGPSGVSYQVRLRGRQDSIDSEAVRSEYQRVFSALVEKQVSYQTVPELMRAEPALSWDSGVADCVVASRVLANRLTSIGHRARARRGYLLGLLGSDHAWTEVFEGGRWKQLDPVAAVLATNALRPLGFQPHAAFQDACLGWSFNRFLPCRTSAAEPLILVAGRFAPQWVTCAVSASPLRNGVFAP